MCGCRGTSPRATARRWLARTGSGLRSNTDASGVSIAAAQRRREPARASRPRLQFVDSAASLNRVPANRRRCPAHAAERCPDVARRQAKGVGRDLVADSRSTGLRRQFARPCGSLGRRRTMCSAAYRCAGASEAPYSARCPVGLDRSAGSGFPRARIRRTGSADSARVLSGT